MSIRRFRSNFADCESLLESNSPDILAVCETNLVTQLILEISQWGIIFLLSERIPPVICMVSQFMWRKDFLLHGTYLLKTLQILICFWLPLLHSVSYFFFLYRSPSWSLSTVFDSISSNIDEVLTINISANVFVFGDFNHKDWLTYSAGTNRPGELCYNFSISNNLIKWLTLLLGS